MFILCRRCCLSDVPTCWFTSQCVSMHAALSGSGSPPSLNLPVQSWGVCLLVHWQPLPSTNCFHTFAPLETCTWSWDHYCPQTLSLRPALYPPWLISTPVSVRFKTYRWPRLSRSIFWFAHAERRNLYYISHTRWTQSTLRSSLTWNFLQVRIKFIENYWPCVLE